MSPIREIGAEAITLEMSRRVRVYMLSVLAILAVGLGGTFFGLAALATFLDPSSKKMVLGLGFPLGVIVTVAAAGVAVYRLLRCPRCDRWVVWGFSMNTSPFASGAFSRCPGCDAELFNADFRRSVRRILVACMLLGMAGGLVSSMMLGRHRSTMPTQIAPK